ncbi:putative cellular morphogenesis protein [Talaromyces proteolyticus]|uniref:Cellular morphogenesis protein n=1 Tax=Talaromyces proteolyticus TaxID=1131652 RepID=A0AAD4KTX0_9EURO|nr:putative cellular morphogenesis protein [Talaromyces proteolyticus]KAH8700797.1 putative cellular morphogenesis protein [Talaromyces proteolyticus]
MRISSLLRSATAAGTSILLSTCQVPVATAFTATPVSLPDLDLSPLGRVALTGDFDSISIYSYQQQTESLPSTNGSQSLLTELPNGVIATLSTADADILAMCPWTRKDGSFAGLIVGGNFTSLGGIQAQGIASYDPTTNTVHNMSGLSGTVKTLLCDQESDSVYVGGDFTVGNSTNAMVWNGSTGWQSLPFDGFNGPISSIVKNANSHFIFGGTFDGLTSSGSSGNSTASSNQNFSQIINLSTANVSSDAQTTISGFIDPRNIICKTDGSDSAGNTWLLDDYSPGFWRADMGFTFQPTKLRLYNTHYQGRGTKSFRLQRLPDTGYMNLTYTDSSTGNTVACDASCPLSNDASEKYRDFELVNSVGMSGFMIQIMEWYGQGAGLDGIEIYQNQIYTYAINDYNEPSCGVEFPSSVKTTGDWTTTSGGSSAPYLTGNVTGSSDLSVTFQPDITQSGNYSILVYTPGCSTDGTCGSRGSVNVTATLGSSSSTQAERPVQTISWQTNEYEKYETIYTGYVEASGSNFRPSVTISPAAGQNNVKVVASRVAFHLINATSTGELNGLYDYDPTQNSTDTDFKTDTIDSIGANLDDTATINSLVQSGDTTYAAGNFSTGSMRNIISFTTSGNATALDGNGLNSHVQSLLLANETLYVGGNFTNTAQGGSQGLSYVAAYSTGSKSWSSLGAGVNGPVTSVLSFPVNTSDGTIETTIAVSGSFDQILAFGSNSSVTVSGFAVWVPSQKNWLENLDDYQMAFNGQLMATANVGNNTTILAGSLKSDGISSRGAVSLTDSNQLALQPLPIDILASQTSGSVSKRDTTSQNQTGVSIGLFDTSNNRNLTILGGHFTAKDTNGSTIQNLLFLNGSNSDMVTGLPSGVDSSSTFTSLAVQDDTLFAGGVITGSVGSSSLNGLVAYNLANSSFVSPQPPALAGSSVTVNSITVRPSSEQIYVGGVFDSVGALPCPGVCVWDTSLGQWSRPGGNMQGVVSSLQWVGSNKLYAVGNLTVENNSTMIAIYDVSSQKWTAVDGASPSAIPGTVTAFGPAATDMSSYWVAGQASNGSTFIIEYDGTKFNSVGQLFGESTSVLGLQVIGLSKAHGSTSYLNDDQTLLITGQLAIPGFGNASAALYNGSTLSPFILSTTSDGQVGSIHQMFTENQNTFSGNTTHHLSVGLVILISFCIALGCVFLIVVIGIILNKIQRHRQGYVRAPTAYHSDRPTSMRRVPPEYLLDSLRQRTAGVPTV